MKVDYSTFEEDESLYGKVNIIDGDSEIKILVELEPIIVLGMKKKA